MIKIFIAHRRHCAILGINNHYFIFKPESQKMERLRTYKENVIKNLIRNFRILPI